MPKIIQTYLNSVKVEFIDDCAYMHPCMREAWVCVRS